MFKSNEKPFNEQEIRRIIFMDVYKVRTDMKKKTYFITL